MGKKRSTDVWLCRDKLHKDCVFSSTGEFGYQIIGGKDKPIKHVKQWPLSNRTVWRDRNGYWLMSFCSRAFGKYLPKSLQLKSGQGPKRIRITIEEVE